MPARRRCCRVPPTGRYCSRCPRAWRGISGRTVYAAGSRPACPAATAHATPSTCTAGPTAPEVYSARFLCWLLARRLEGSCRGIDDAIETGNEAPLLLLTDLQLARDQHRRRRVVERLVGCEPYHDRLIQLRHRSEAAAPE